jgi:hypothetical protein
MPTRRSKRRLVEDRASGVDTPRLDPQFVATNACTAAAFSPDAKTASGVGGGTVAAVALFPLGAKRSDIPPAHGTITKEESNFRNATWRPTTCFRVAPPSCYESQCFRHDARTIQRLIQDEHTLREPPYAKLTRILQMIFSASIVPA